MARDGAAYVCQSCGAVHSKWAGQCTACQAWNSLVEEVQARQPGAIAPSRGAKAPGSAWTARSRAAMAARRPVPTGPFPLKAISKLSRCSEPSA